MGKVETFTNAVLYLERYVSSAKTRKETRALKEEAQRGGASRSCRTQVLSGSSMMTRDMRTSAAFRPGTAWGACKRHREE